MHYQKSLALMDNKEEKGEQLLDLELKAVAPNCCFVLSCLNLLPVFSDLPIKTPVLSK